MSAPASNPTALVCQGVSVHWGRQAVLQDVDWHLPSGRWCAVVGPNGAGKSTLLKAVAGLMPEGAGVTGSIELHGQALHALPRKERARGLAWLSSGSEAADDLVAQDVVSLGRTPHTGWLSGLNAADEAAVMAAMRTTGTLELKDRRVGSLSAGERQRVLLARALAVQAGVLLMDEPLSHLDPPHQADWLGAVQALKEQGVAVASVLHDLQLALMADDLLVLHQGRVLAHGPSSSPEVHAALQAAFDHRLRILQVSEEGLHGHGSPRWVVFIRPGSGPLAQ